jgi:hypothetical protein
VPRNVTFTLPEGCLALALSKVELGSIGDHDYEWFLAEDWTPTGRSVVETLQTRNLRGKSLRKTLLRDFEQ